MNREAITDAIETERLLLFPYTAENLALFNTDLSAFEEKYGVRYQGEELDYLLRNFLRALEKEIAEDPAHYLFFTEFLIVLKESDRIAATVRMLTALGAEAGEAPDGLWVKGTSRLRGGTVDGANDHRIVMAAAVAATHCENPVKIRGAEAAEKSYAAFWADLARLGGRVRWEEEP